MYYKYFNIEEIYAATTMLDWFASEAMSGKVRFDDNEKKWITDPNMQLPSWKHLTRGGHKKGMNISRGGIGCYVRLSRGKESTHLIFRRHSRDQRIFVVQRFDDLDVTNDVKFKLQTNACICKDCMNFNGVKSKLKFDDFQLYKEL
jgi:hypothetical protein